MKQIEKDLKKLFYKIEHPASYGTAQALVDASHHKYNIDDVQNWLKSQDAYTLHKPRRLHFQRQRYFVTGMNQLWQSDLCDLTSIHKNNDGIKFLVCVIDVLSKRAKVYAVKNKTGKNIKEAFAVFFQGEKPESLMTDKGREYRNTEFQSYLKKNNVHYFTSQNPDTKAAIIERFIRTFKTKLWKYFTHSGSYRYIDNLQKFVQSYNNKIHSSIKMAPNSVNASNVFTAWQNLYSSQGRYPKIDYSIVKRPKLSLGDHVRITKEKFHFAKGFETNWSDELFIIHSIKQTNPVLYTLVDLQSVQIEGSFYEQELQSVKVKKDSKYKIEKILQTKGKGKNKLHLIKWRGYTDAFNSWIKASDLTTI